jgi:hypothetical protein
VSKNKFLYGKASADLKLVPGDSAGVVTAFYVSEYFLSSRFSELHFLLF